MPGNETADRLHRVPTHTARLLLHPARPPLYLIDFVHDETGARHQINSRLPVEEAQMRAIEQPLRGVIPTPSCDQRESYGVVTDVRERYNHRAAGVQQSV